MRATLDMFVRLETDSSFLALYRSFTAVRRKPGRMIEISQIPTDQENSNQNNCFLFLNFYELTALAIRRKILDEKFFRQAYEEMLAKDWQVSLPLIKAAREPSASLEGGSTTTYQHYEWLMKRWGKDKLPRK